MADRGAGFFMSSRKYGFEIKTDMTLAAKIGDNDPMSEISNTKVVAVTVTFNIDQHFEAVLQSYLEQVDLVVIVDNSTRIESRKCLSAIAEKLGERIKLVLNGENLGLAKAQNMGIALALDESPDWVLLMDDDSTASENMVRHLANAVQNYGLDPKTAIIVPQNLEQGVKREARYVVAAGGRYRIPQFSIADFSSCTVLENLFIAISSGSLIKAYLFHEIGKIRESFEIDYLDVDFCLRAIAKGYRIAAVKEAVLKHNLGAQTEHWFLGRRFWAWNHSAQRRFTIYRNRTRIWREYLFHFPGFILYDVLATLQDLFRILMFEQNKISKFSSIIRGFGVGLFGSGIKL
jgi:rhamnosyltransferase